MKNVSVLLVAFVCVMGVAMAAAPSRPACFKRPAHEVPTHVLSPEPHTYLQVGDLPPSFDWRNVSGVNYATLSRNQHVPQYCGSCWAFGALSAFNDRIKIMRSAQWPDVVTSPQVLLNCASDIGTCNGGSPTGVYDYVMKNGIPDETCSPYLAKDEECDPENVCKNCTPEKCWAQKPQVLYYVKEHGTINGEANMMAEIFARGPIACGMDVTAEFENYTGGIFKDTTGAQSVNHIISIVGWGVDPSGTKYWIGRNSWGTYWGERGWFRIVRGVNNLAIESYCDWAVPVKNFPF